MNTAMDKFFDRLGDLLESLLDLGRGGQSSGSYDPRDPDMREAIEELDEYLKSGGFDAGEFASAGAENRSRSRRATEEEQRFTAAGAADENLRRDYATLEVSFAAPFTEVRKSYKRLLHKYHPDRFSGDGEKQALANEVTQRLNEAFARIEKRYRKRSR
ncbi:MAG: J domain-containing protein [Spirochaetaceae bacterium]|nr:MAG: J domain-containing protein [Spirochaetaceae bacterium]